MLPARASGCLLSTAPAEPGSCPALKSAAAPDDACPVRGAPLRAQPPTRKARPMDLAPQQPRPATSTRRHRVRRCSATLLLCLASATVVGGRPVVAATPDAVQSVGAQLAVGQTLRAGQALVSPGASYRLLMQSDGNLVQYGPAGARWATGTDGNPGAVLRFQSDGNLVLQAVSGQVLWTTLTYGSTAASSFVMQSDGNQVAYAASGRPVWQSQTLAPQPSAGPFTSPDGRFVARMGSDGDFTVTYQRSATPDVLWHSGTGGHRNAYLAVQDDGNVVVYESGAALWNSGTAGQPGARPALQADGNLVVSTRAGQPLWSSGTSNAAAGIQESGDPRFHLTWAHAFPGSGSPISLGSPSVGTLDGAGPAAVLGTRAGGLYAFHLGDGGAVPGWPVDTGGVAVDSTPSIIGSGSSAQVFVGLGTSARPENGGVMAVDGSGKVRWNKGFAAFPPGEPVQTAGVQGSVGVGRLQAPAGQYDVIAGTMRQQQYAFNSSTGALLQGFPWFGADSNFSTPALADLYGRGSDVVVEGGDSTAGNAFNTQYSNGGHLRILNPTGNLGLPKPSDGLVCQYDTDQVMQSSPAVGPFLQGGRTGIVAGTGSFYAGASDTAKVIAIDPSCRLAWKAALDGPTGASPALVDVLGNNGYAVVQGTNKSPTSGTVYALDGATGATLWRTPIGGGVYGSITSIDLGGGYESLLVPTATGVFILDGRSGRVVDKLVDYVGVLNTALVTVDPGGVVGVTVGGYNGVNRSITMHFELTGSHATTVSGPGQWPMFHANPRLTGVAN